MKKTLMIILISCMAGTAAQAQIKTLVDKRPANHLVPHW